MSKELLKITHVNEGACEAELDCSNTYEKELVAAGLVSMMVGDEEMADLIIKYVTFYLANDKKELTIKRLRQAHRFCRG